MKESLVMSQWTERGWIWTEKEELISILDVLYHNGYYNICLQITPSGYFVRKVY